MEAVLATAAEAPVPVFVMQAGSDSMIMPCQVCALGDMLGVQTITAPQVAHDLMLVSLPLGGTGGKSWSAGRARLLTYHLSQPLEPVAPAGHSVAGGSGDTGVLDHELGATKEQLCTCVSLTYRLQPCQVEIQILIWH